MTENVTQLQQNEGWHEDGMINEEDSNKLEENNTLEHANTQGARTHAYESAATLGAHESTENLRLSETNAPNPFSDDCDDVTHGQANENSISEWARSLRISNRLDNMHPDVNLGDKV